MRTTVTLDPDVVAELKARIKKGESSFKVILNQSLREFFALSRSGHVRRAKFKVRPHRSPFADGVDPFSLNQLYDEISAEDFGRRGK